MKIRGSYLSVSYRTRTMLWSSLLTILLTMVRLDLARGQGDLDKTGPGVCTHMITRLDSVVTSAIQSRVVPYNGACSFLHHITGCQIYKVTFQPVYKQTTKLLYMTHFKCCAGYERQGQKCERIPTQAPPPPADPPQGPGGGPMPDLPGYPVQPGVQPGLGGRGQRQGVNGYPGAFVPRPGFGGPGTPSERTDFSPGYGPGPGPGPGTGNRPDVNPRPGFRPSTPTRQPRTEGGSRTGNQGGGGRGNGGGFGPNNGPGGGGGFGPNNGPGGGRGFGPNNGPGGGFGPNNGPNSGPQNPQYPQGPNQPPYRPTRPGTGMGGNRGGGGANPDRGYPNNRGAGNGFRPGLGPNQPNGPGVTNGQNNNAAGTDKLQPSNSSGSGSVVTIMGALLGVLAVVFVVAVLIMYMSRRRDSTGRRSVRLRRSSFRDAAAGRASEAHKSWKFSIYQFRLQ